MARISRQLNRSRRYELMSSVQKVKYLYYQLYWNYEQIQKELNISERELKEFLYFTEVENVFRNRQNGRILWIDNIVGVR